MHKFNSSSGRRNAISPPAQSWHSLCAMLTRHLTYQYLIFLTSILFGCNNPSGNTNVESIEVDTLTTNKQINDNIDYFKNSVNSLVHINYFMSGKDSLIVSNDPSDFIEMNGIRYCFQHPFDKSDTGLIAYRQINKVRKFHVAKNKKQNGPSANIIEISFNDADSALKWYDRLTQCKDFEVIKMKPKTEIWLKNRSIYFIQSYYDPDGRVLVALTNEIRQNIK